MIVVSGVSGNIGGEVVRLLVRAGAPVRAISRDPSKLAPKPGYEVVKADLTDPASLHAALAGTQKLFVVAHAIDLPRAASVAAVASERAGVRHVVLVSSSTIAIHPEVTIGRWHREAEEIVQSSGLQWTFLRVGNLATNTLRWAATIRTQRTVFSPAGGNTAPVDPRDIASVGAKALMESGHEGKTYILTGPTMMTQQEQVAQIGEAIGRALRLVEVPPHAARAAMVKTGMPEVVADGIVELIVAAAEGRNSIRTSTVRDVAGHEPRSFADWVRANVSAFQ